MKVKLVSLEDGITSCGFRKIAAYVARLNPDTEACYVSTRRYRSVTNSIKGTIGGKGELGDDEVDEIAQGLAGTDLVGFSSMTGYSELTKRIITRLRAGRPDDLHHLGRHPPDHPPRGRDPRRRRRHLHRRGRVRLRGALRPVRATAATTPASENFWFKRADGDTIVRNGFLPADDGRGDGDPAVPPVRAERADLPPGRGLRPARAERLPGQRRPRLHDPVVDRLPVPLLVLRQHQVHRQRPAVQEDPPPERPLHRRRGQGRPRPPARTSARSASTTTASWPSPTGSWRRSPSCGRPSSTSPSRCTGSSPTT